MPLVPACGYTENLILNTHFLLDFIYFQKTIDFSLSSVTSSHMQIWKIITKILDGVKVL
jgi:hypothetical protein